jgi:hypothetical protein
MRNFWRSLSGRVLVLNIPRPALNLRAWWLSVGTASVWLSVGTASATLKASTRLA